MHRHADFTHRNQNGVFKFVHQTQVKAKTVSRARVGPTVSTNAVAVSIQPLRERFGAVDRKPQVHLVHPLPCEAHRAREQLHIDSHLVRLANKITEGNIISVATLDAWNRPRGYVTGCTS